MQISIKEVAESKTSRGGPMLRLTTAGGEKLACFHAELFPLLRPGAVVEVETERRGNYSPNIIAAMAIGTDGESPPQMLRADASALQHDTGSGIGALEREAPPRNDTRRDEQAATASSAGVLLASSSTGPPHPVSLSRAGERGNRKGLFVGEIGRDASIEAQTAAKNVTELICAGKLEVGGVAGQLAMAWNIGRLEAALPEAVVSAVTQRAKNDKKAASKK